MIYGVPSDEEIDDRRRIAEALRQSEALFRTLTETTASAIFIYQGDRFRYVNPATETLTGYNSEEIEHMSLWDVAHPDFHQLIRKRGLARQHSRPIPVRHEFVIVTKEGEHRWVDFTGGTIEYQGEQAILGTAFDITERKKAEQALGESEENYRTLVENIPIGVYRSTPGSQGMYLMANPAFLQMFGFRSEKELKEVVVADVYVDRSQRKAFSDNLLARGSVAGVELHLKRKDGTPLWGSITARVVRDGLTGEVAYFDCSIEDITERKLAEEALRRRAGELARLHQLSFDISAVANTLPDLLKVIVTRARRLLDASEGSLSLCDQEKEELHLVVKSNISKSDNVSATIKYGVGMVGRIAQDGKALILNGYLAWDGSLAEFEEEQPYRAVLGVPLIWQGEVIGVLQVWDNVKIRRFGDPDLELLTLFANQSAIAIANARLREAERAQLLLARTLQDVGALLTSQLGLDEVLESILDLLGRVVNYDSASIQLIGEDGLLDLSAGRGFPDIDHARETVRELSELILERNWSLGTIAVIPDTFNSADWVVSPGSEYIRSWIGAALLVKGRFIGILNVDSRTVNAYDEPAGETVMAFANQAAIAIENARLFEAEEKRVAQLEALRQAGLSLTSSLDLEAVLDAILESSLKLLPSAQVAHVFLYHPDGEGHVTFGAALWADGRRGEPIAQPRSSGLTHTVARSGEAVIVPDMRAHPLYEGTPEEWTGSIVGLPLKVGRQVVGVMNVASAQTGAFPKDDLGILRLLSDQAAIAIENARLFEQAATERRHLGLLYDIGRELAVSLDPDEILDRAVTLTCKALDGVLGEAFVYQPENDHRLSLRAIYGREPQYDVEALDQQLNLKLGVGMAGWVAERRQAAIVGEVKNDSRWMFALGTDEEVSSALIAPILQEDRLLGVLAVLHHRENAFSQDHLVLLQAICHQVGLALINAERYQQVQSLVDLLAAEQDRLESLMEHLPAGVLLLDADYRLVVTNSLGRAILSVFGFDDQQQFLTNLGPYEIEDLIARHTSPLPVEIALEGSQRVFEAEARALGEERPQWVITVREVTEEHENQARIQMQERLATVGQLAAGIAHDFNNIMAAIMVYTDLLGRDIEKLPDSKERLGIIRQQVRRASSLIRQILDFSRRSVMEQITLDILPFIKELDRLLERLLPENIHLELLYQPGSYLIKADPTRLQQVFMNLAVNARDAMPEGGTLSFEIARIRVEPQGSAPIPDMEPGDWIRLTVRDTGVGIPAETLPHIFEPFFSTKPSGEGTGLGLAQAYGIVRQHGGHIDVHSQLAEGSTFTIYLPSLPVPEREEDHWEEAAEVSGEGQLILLVEDDRVTRDALEAMLETQNYRVSTAANGAEALRIYEQKREAIRLVVSDVVMPEMGGVELYHALRDRWPEVKMLFITGHPLQEEDQALLEGGSVDWIQKPFSVAEFGRLVNKLLMAESF